MSLWAKIKGKQTEFKNPRAVGEVLGPFVIDLKKVILASYF